MKYTKPIVIAAVLLIIGLAGAAVMHPNWSKAKADSQLYSASFNATLTPEQEMMGTTTASTTTSINSSTASGTAQFNLTADNTMLAYDVTVSNLTSAITGAHLHCGPVGQTGQVIVPLMATSSATTTTNSAMFSGTISENDILPAAMSCNPNIKTMSHLVQAIREGQIYVNVHTEQYPMGEVRGQLMEMLSNVATSTTATSTATTTTPTTSTTTEATSTDTSTSTDSTSSPQATTSQATTSPTGWYYVMVKPDAYYKIQGSSVTFSGSHFSPNETVSVSRDGSFIGTVAANSSGDFSSTYTIPYSLGQHTYSFMGSASQIAFPVYMTVGNNAPWIGLSTYYAPVGSSVTITGHQFGANENVTLVWSGTTVGTATTDASGNFTFTTTVPSTSASQTTVSATGVSTGLTTSQPFSTQ